MSVFVLQVFLFIKRHKQQKFSQSASKSLSKRQRLIISIVSTIFFAKAIITALYHIFVRRSAKSVISRYPFVSGLNFTASSALAVTMYSCKHLLYDPSWTAMSFHSLSVFVVYFHIRDQLDRLIRAANSADERMMISVSLYIERTFALFEENFSSLPLIGLGDHFFYSVWALSTFTELPATGRPAFLSMTAFHQLFIILDLLVISFLSENIRRQRFSIKVAHKEASYDLRSISCSLARSIDDATDCQFTVWRICAINRSFIFTYIGTIAIFSTLILQFKQ